MQSDYYIIVGCYNCVTTVPGPLLTLEQDIHWITWIHTWCSLMIYLEVYLPYAGEISVVNTTGTLLREQMTGSTSYSYYDASPIVERIRYPILSRKAKLSPAKREGKFAFPVQLTNPRIGTIPVDAMSPESNFDQAHELTNNISSEHSLLL